MKIPPHCSLLVASFLVAPFHELGAASILINGEFSGSLSSWTTSGTVFNTGNSAVFSDSVSPAVTVFQSGSFPGSLVRLELSFDFFNGLSPSVPPGFVPDGFFATLYLGASPFGPTLVGGIFDQALGLFDLDSSGAFNPAPGASFSASPKGAGWTRFTLSQASSPAFTSPGFATVAFEFYNLNGTGSDSVVAIDNVSLVTVVPEPGPSVLLGFSLALPLVRRRR
jgi:hypothetical protein